MDHHQTFSSLNTLPKKVTDLMDRIKDCELIDNLDVYELIKDDEFDSLVALYLQISDEDKQTLKSSLRHELGECSAFLLAAFAVANALSDENIPAKEDVAFCCTTLEGILQDQEDLDETDQRVLSFYISLYINLLEFHLTEDIQEGQTKPFLIHMKELVRLYKLYPNDEAWQSDVSKELLEFEVVAHLVSFLLDAIAQKALTYAHRTVTPEELKEWFGNLLQQECTFSTINESSTTVSYASLDQDRQFITLIFILCAAADIIETDSNVSDFYEALALVVDVDYTQSFTHDDECGQDCEHE